MILAEHEAKEIVEKALSFSTASEIRVNLSGGREGNTRFARNSITTSGDVDALSVTVTAYFGRKHGTATGTQVDEDSLRRVVQQAEELARFAPEDPEYVPELGPQQYLPIDAYFPQTAQASPALRASGVFSCIRPAEAKGLMAAGFFIHGHGFMAIGNNKGLFAYHQGTNASFSTTVRAPDGTASGWAGADSRNINDIDPPALGAKALDKAQTSAHPVALEPGKYTVILEPQAVADFLIFALWAMNARQADEGRSFYSRKGGGNKIGERVVGENITIVSDPTHPELRGTPFDGEGFPAQKQVWIEKGVLKQLYYSRYWAQKQGKEPTGFPTNLVFQGGTASLEEMIRSTDRGILVTRFWYIRYVDPQTLLLTGLTRDGTFYIEKGRLKYPIKNFRFNESPIVVLNKVEVLSPPVRVGSSLMPAVKATEFTFSSLSEAV